MFFISLFWGIDFDVFSSLAIMVMLVALLCDVAVSFFCVFSPWYGLKSMIVAFSGHIH